MGDALLRVEDALRAAGSDQKFGGNWNCPGSMHSNGDRKPSLSISYNGRTVRVKCHTGCSTEDILDILGLGMTDLFDEPLVRKEVARYKYLSHDGEVLFAKIRMEPKDFRIKHPVGDTWEGGLGEIQRVIYNLPRVLETAKAGGQVFIVEGEKDVDRLTSLGVTATCNFEGAGTGKSKWKPEYSEWLRGASMVVVIADRDDPGVAHAKGIAESVKPFVGQVTIMQSRTQGIGDDVSDHLDAGYNLDQLAPLQESEITAKYQRIDWFSAFKEEPEDIRWIKEDFLEAGTLNCLFSKPGIGKSLISLEVAIEAVRNGMTVSYFDDENRKADIVDRLRSFRVTPDELSNFIVYNFQNLPPLDTEAGGEHLDALMETDKPDLVILDTISRMIKGSENDADTYIQLYRCSLTRLKRRGITTMRLDHVGKDSSRGQRGSSAKESDADVLWSLSRDAENMFTLECQKSRSGHIQFGTIINLTREYEPLRHQWNVRIDMPLDRFEGIMRQMDIMGIPLSLGRPAVRKVFKDNNVVAVRNDQLSAAIIERRNRARRLPPVVEDSSGQGDNQDEDCPF